MGEIKTYKDLLVWQKAMDFVVEVYRVTESFPKSEVYGLVSQMRRAAVSIPSNIAEGRRRSSRRDFRQFIVIAYGSAAELETQIEIARRIGYCTGKIAGDLEKTNTELLKMLNGLSASLS